MTTNVLRKKDLNANIYLSEGNKKLVRNELEYFLIWNLPSVKTCPYRTALCEKFCYAKKSESFYKGCLPCRERNLLEVKKESFVDDMDSHIKYQLARKKNQGKQCYFRIHESGDFFSTEYAYKWFRIAEKNPDVIFTAYTKSVKLLASIMAYKPENMVIRYSVWADTKQDDIALAEALQMPIYTAYEPSILEAKIKEEGFIKCDCDCTKCKMCYHVEYKKIAVAIH